MPDLKHRAKISPASMAVIVPAAGSGRRFGDRRNKLFAILDGKPLWMHSILTLSSNQVVGRIVLAVAPTDEPTFSEQAAQLNVPIAVDIVLGGEERLDSVNAALSHVVEKDAIRWVAVHDAARPLVSAEDLDRVFAKAAESGAAILAEPVASTVKRTRNGGVSCETLDRSELWLAQTPQVFRKDILARAYERHRGRHATDDAELVSRGGVNVAIVAGSTSNLKITFPSDLAIAESILQQRQQA
ncbi:MAG: 2-C-methyl-D-erythritol 4-phosphate cytidylyltransferase [Planctomycetota bacterium]